MERHVTMDSLEEDQPYQPRAYVTLEYVEKEQTLNFYIKKIEDPPLHVEGRRRHCLARLILIKNIARTTWTGRQRTITEQDISEKSSRVFKTLEVRKQNPTIFNEFFSDVVEQSHFHRTLLRIQLVDVTRSGREVVTGEGDYWIDSNPILRFTQFALPMSVPRPDLGELELSLLYQPTIGRIVVSDIIATNLPSLKDTKNLVIRGRLFIKSREVEEERSEERDSFSEESTRFVKKLIFDCRVEELTESTLIISLLQRTSKRMEGIGEVLLSHREPSCDQLHWSKMLSANLEKQTETHKMLPTI